MIHVLENSDRLRSERLKKAVKRLNQENDNRRLGKQFKVIVLMIIIAVVLYFIRKH